MAKNATPSTKKSEGVKAAPTAAAATPAKPPVPTVGRLVLFALPVIGPDGAIVRVEERAAQVVHVWNRDDGKMPLVQLLVFRDGSNDGYDAIGKLPTLPDAIDPMLRSFLDALAGKVRAVEQLVTWRTSVDYDEGGRPGTWHWMPYQLGQAAKTDDVGSKLQLAHATLEHRVDELEKRPIAGAPPAAPKPTVCHQ